MLKPTLNLCFGKDKIYPRGPEQEDQSVSHLQKSVALLLSHCSQVFPKRGILKRKLLLFMFVSNIALPQFIMEETGNASYFCKGSN